MQEKLSIIVARYRHKFPSVGSRFGITRQSLVMPNGDPRDGNFCLYLTAMNDTYSLKLGVLFSKLTMSMYAEPSEILGKLSLFTRASLLVKADLMISS